MHRYPFSQNCSTETAEQRCNYWYLFAQKKKKKFSFTLTKVIQNPLLRWKKSKVLFKTVSRFWRQRQRVLRPLLQKTSWSTNEFRSDFGQRLTGWFGRICYHEVICVNVKLSKEDKTVQREGVHQQTLLPYLGTHEASQQQNMASLWV